MRYTFSLLVCFVTSLFANAQTVVYNPAIKSVKLFKAGDQTSFPAIVLNSGDLLQLEFDELGTSVKNYYCGFVLCNADWSPSGLTSFDYTRGFQSIRISTYRNSSLATMKYVHYSATVPDRNSAPSRSGNYLLKVFLNNDTTQLAFVKRFVVVNTMTQIAAQVQQPFNATLYRTGQKLQLGIQADRQINVLSPSDIKVAVLQNENWQTALFLDKPTIYRGNYFEYSDESITCFVGLKEFRWLDLRSLRLRSDRMERLDNMGDTVRVIVKPETSRNEQTYVYFRDLNGGFTIESYENINPYWQGDYAYTHFKYFPPGNKPLAGNDVYIFGEMTNYGADTTGLMHFNEESGAYEKTLLLKQGYYNYLYGTRPFRGGPLDFSQTEGNFWATENNYTVFVYYRPFGSRADECVGYTSFNSVFQRQGL
ncbi:DUF5103 domain-containing protein [Flavisolibacter ginsenosidimutans]|uniref:DUF5103 domain-containing protein n=1 Tax=Flavisolibacter ginsenosidimutans TaxID=661481 RepID=A0A5B8UF22_9BACT|nr:DUF5103 domain-containing protein [Flavisolibacter ginsenosidimutans]QEC55164.1 DUF5103 domain-containing protein [Flavisolibacter ginsenosidimutans]